MHPGPGYTHFLELRFNFRLRVFAAANFDNVQVISDLFFYFELEHCISILDIVNKKICFTKSETSMALEKFFSYLRAMPTVFRNFNSFKNVQS